jgi:hypothetical protein
MTIEALLARLKTAGTPNADEGAGDGAGSEHVAATPNDERRAAGSDNFSGVPVFSVFHDLNNQTKSVSCSTNSLEHLPHEPVFQVFRSARAADEAAFSERAAVLEFDAGLTRDEAERQAANEQGFATSDELFGTVAGGWAERLRAMQAAERSKRGQQCLMWALAFIEHGWALEALRCGWTELELVGACPRKPWERLDRLGVAYSMFTPIDVTPETILYRSSGKQPLRRLRGSQADGADLPWERAR